MGGEGGGREEEEGGEELGLGPAVGSRGGSWGSEGGGAGLWNSKQLLHILCGFLSVWSIFTLLVEQAEQITLEREE